MKKSFFLEQNEASRKLYIDLLEVTAALSNMFADSKNPFLYYRAMENIFCKSFQADNLSRSDVSVDASKNGLGIGLKTFLQNNGNSFQKVAEFNKDSYLFKGLEGIGLIKKVAFMRNERIKSTMRICNLSDMIYHLITRSENYMAIFEEHMDLIDIENISITAINNTTIHFTDGLHDYNFSLSKSTLLKRFDTTDKNKLYGFNVEILEVRDATEDEKATGMVAGAHTCGCGGHDHDHEHECCGGHGHGEGGCGCGGHGHHHH